MHQPYLKAAALFAAGVRGVACSVNYTELQGQLSSTASIYLPGSAAFDDAVARWSNLSTPTSNVVVVPATEDDVVTTVCSPSHVFPIQNVWDLFLIFAPYRSSSQTRMLCHFSLLMACMVPSRLWVR